MIVKCIANSGNDLPEDALIPDLGYGRNFQYHLIIGKYYVVYSMKLIDGYIWYTLCDEGYTYYPFYNPSPLFSVVNGHLSRYWIFSFTREEKESYTLWAFPEWANNLYYYSRLAEGEKKEIEIFKKYKALMDLEFPDPSISDKATSLEDNWLLCPFCIDAWETESKDGMVICPKCQRKLMNPNYEDRSQIGKNFG